MNNHITETDMNDKVEVTHTVAANQLADAMHSAIMRFETIRETHPDIYLDADLARYRNALSLFLRIPSPKKREQVFAGFETATAQLQAERDELVEALKAIRDMKARPYSGPSFDKEGSAQCPDCQRYEGHPIQRGICDEHRKPFYAQQDHAEHQERALGYRLQIFARDVLTKIGDAK